MDDIRSTLTERGKRYGEFKDHARISGELKAVVHDNDGNLESFHRESLEMICHKMARILNGDPNYDDSWIDIAGYAQLVVDILNKKKDTDQ